MVAARFLGILFGTEMPSGLTSGNFFSFVFLIASCVSLFLFFFVSKFSYGVSKLTELTLKSSLIAPALFLLGIGFLGDLVRAFTLPSNYNALNLITLAFALLSALSLFIFAFAVIKNAKRSGILLIVFPILYYCASLIKTFFENMSSLTNTNAGVLTFKLIFNLLFFLYLLNFLVDPENLKGAGSVILFGAFSVVFNLSVIVPSITLYFYDKQKFGSLLSDVQISDFSFVISAIIFTSAIISAITRKSNSLKAKVSEE